MELNVFDIGPMVDGISVDLGFIPDAAGTRYMVLLQFGGRVPSTIRTASCVDGLWVKNPPPPPRTHPVVTLAPAQGGPRATFDAAGFIENARCRLGFLMCNLWDDGKVISFSAEDMAHLGAAIEQAIPEPLGGFEVRWVPVTDDGLPF
ncbi:hypothetical protein [Variovorax sp. ZT4R33]|uniref:hypothetical protein n=1 Tax=Variovorax sp. ZT4R33 TaxID=3443743 RepID=UPI003F45A0D7